MAEVSTNLHLPPNAGEELVMKLPHPDKQLRVHDRIAESVQRDWHEQFPLW
jgi:hypothetical protein